MVPAKRETQAGKYLFFKNRPRVFNCPHLFMVLREEQSLKRARTVTTGKQLEREDKRETSFIFGAFENHSAELPATGPRGVVYLCILGSVICVAGEELDIATKNF